MHCAKTAQAQKLRKKAFFQRRWHCFRMSADIQQVTLRNVSHSKWNLTNQQISCQSQFLCINLRTINSLWVIPVG
jgi:hypothetical protein